MSRVGRIQVSVAEISRFSAEEFPKSGGLQQIEGSDHSVLLIFASGAGRDRSAKVRRQIANLQFCRAETDWRIKGFTREAVRLRHPMPVCETAHRARMGALTKTCNIVL